MNKKKLLTQFFIKASIFYFIWLILYHGYIVPSGTINNSLTKAVAKGTQFGTTLIGYDTSIEFEEDTLKKNHIRGIIYLNQTPAVTIADGCNGLALIALYIGFIVSFPGKLWPKLSFSILGAAIIYMLNIFREVLLALNYLYFRASFDFNHKYTYALAVYLIVLLMWRYWLNKYSILAPKKNE